MAPGRNERRSDKAGLKEKRSERFASSHSASEEEPPGCRRPLYRREKEQRRRSIRPAVAGLAADLQRDQI